LKRLLDEKVLVPLVPVKREGRRALPYAPVWCMTVHKTQGATLNTAVLHVMEQVSAPLLYTAMTRVRDIENLWFLKQLNASLYLALKFAPSVHEEMKRLSALKGETRAFLDSLLMRWSLDEVIDLGAFGLREAEEAVAIENDDPAAAALKLTKLTIAPLAKIDELGHVTSENWIQAALMLNCSLMLVLEAQARLGTLAMPKLSAKLTSAQQNAIRRVYLLLELEKDRRGRTVGVLAKKEWALIGKKEKENDWKKLFKQSCLGLMKKVLKKKQ